MQYRSMIAIMLDMYYFKIIPTLLMISRDMVNCIVTNVCPAVEEIRRIISWER